MTVLDPFLTNEDANVAYQSVSQLLDQERDLVGLYVIGGISGVLRSIREAPEKRRSEVRVVCRDVGSEARNGLTKGIISTSLYHPIPVISEQLIQTMLEVLPQDEPASMIQRIVLFGILPPENV